MIIIILIAISLSMDAFSLSLAYGMYNFTKKEIITLSCLVGIFHVFMPLIGYLCGNVIFSFFKANSVIIVSLIFFLLGIEMLIDTFKKETKKTLKNIFEMISFSLAVSIDSFTTGIGIISITNNYMYSFIIFGIFSFLFTFIGLYFGKYIGEKIGNYSTILGAVILFIIAIYNLIK